MADRHENETDTPQNDFYSSDELEAPEQEHESEAISLPPVEFTMDTAPVEAFEATNRATPPVVVPVTTPAPSRARLQDMRWVEYPTDDPRFFQQLHTVLAALGWPHLVLEDNPMLNCGQGQTELEDYLHRLEHTPNNQLARVRGEAAIHQLLANAVRREADNETAAAAAQWRESHW